MIERAAKVLGPLAVLVAFPGSAFAVPVAVPEPDSISLLAVGSVSAIGVYAIRKWMKRK